MRNEETDQIVFLVVIAGRKQKDSLLRMLSESDAHLINTLYGRGAADASYLKNVLGLVAEENKVVITCAITQNHLEAVLETLHSRFKFERPNTGIAFSIPIDKVLF